MSRSRVLRLAPGLSVPADQFAESATFLIGKRKSGKSGGIKVIEEELFRIGIPFVTLDPVGVHWGIRSSADGKSPGLPVLVIGGSHGDVRLDRRAGAATARAILEANISCVIDFSEESKNVYREFVRDFARELYAKNQTPRVVIVEEAPELIPQKVQRDRADTFEAVERLVSRGRNKGLGFIGVSQRAATINKDALTQADNLFIGRLVSPQDRKALGEWVEAWDVKDRLGKFMEDLASLPTRTMYLWSPETLQEFKQVRFNDFQTLHGDRTHLNRLGLMTAQPVTTDVSSVVEKLGKELGRLSKEKEGAQRVPALEREVARLKEMLARETARTSASVPVVDGKAIEQAAQRTIAERDAFWKGQMAKVARSQEKATRAGQMLLEAMAEMPTLSRTPSEATMNTYFTGQENQTRAFPKEPPKVRARVVEAPLVPLGGAAAVGGASVGRGPTLVSPPANGGEEPIHLKAGARRMLQELASRYPLTLTYSQLATLAGMTPSGGTATTYRGILFRAGLIEEDRDGGLHVTQAGLDYLGTDVPPAPSTHAEVMRRWESALKKGTYRLLTTVVDRYPNWVSNEEAADVADLTASAGTYTTYRGILVRNGLIESTADGLRALPVLFPEDR